MDPWNGFGVRSPTASANHSCAPPRFRHRNLLCRAAIVSTDTPILITRGFLCTNNRVAAAEPPCINVGSQTRHTAQVVYQRRDEKPQDVRPGCGFRICPKVASSRCNVTDLHENERTSHPHCGWDAARRRQLLTSYNERKKFSRSCCCSEESRWKL